MLMDDDVWVLPGKRSNGLENGKRQGAAASKQMLVLVLLLPLPPVLRLRLRLVPPPRPHECTSASSSSAAAAAWLRPRADLFQVNSRPLQQPKLAPRQT